MRKIIIAAIFICVGIIQVVAQNKSILLNRINEVKAQTDTYFWDQYTHPDADTAKINATKRLLLDVNLYREGKSELSVEEIMPYVSYVILNRGNLKQQFAYIEKQRAATIGEGAVPVLQEVNSQPQSKHENNTVAAQPIPQPVPESAKSTNASVPVQKKYVPDAFIQRIVEAKMFMNVYKLLKSLQNQGQILQFGKLKDVEDYSSFELILFDMSSQELISILSPITSSGDRINMIDGTQDSLDNYPTNMTAVIWYIKH